MVILTGFDEVILDKSWELLNFYNSVQAFLLPLKWITASDFCTKIFISENVLIPTQFAQRTSSDKNDDFSFFRQKNDYNYCTTIKMNC